MTEDLNQKVRILVSSAFANLTKESCCQDRDQNQEAVAAHTLLQVLIVDLELAHTPHRALGQVLTQVLDTVNIELNLNKFKEFIDV